MKKMAFIIPPTVELLDLAGPVQVFTEAKFNGFEIALEFYQFQETPVSTSVTTFADGNCFCNSLILLQCVVHSVFFNKPA